jgi:hypothetical protein
MSLYKSVKSDKKNYKYIFKYLGAVSEIKYRMKAKSKKYNFIYVKCKFFYIRIIRYKKYKKKQLNIYYKLQKARWLLG